MVSSPNATYVPTPPIGRQYLRSYEDGRWGLHEHSRWPQFARKGFYHLACIPRYPSGRWHKILFETLLPQSHFRDSPRAGVPGYGYLKVSVLKDLRSAIAAIFNDVWTIPYGKSSHRKWAERLTVMACMTIDRLERVPSSPLVSIALGAQLQRLCLEMAGLATYFTVVVPRLDDGSFSSVGLLADCLGALSYDAGEVWNLWRVGVPVWYVRPMNSDMRVQSVVELLPWQHYLSGQRDHEIVSWTPRCVAGFTFQHTTYEELVTTTSEELCGQRPAFPAGSVVQAQEEPPRKRARLQEVRQVVRMPAVPSRRQRAAPKGGTQGSPSALCAAIPSTSGGLEPDFSGRVREQPKRPHWQPSLVYYESGFYRIPRAWALALKEVGLVHEANHPALYFYPPPFLLDTVRKCELADGAKPPGARDVDALREDEKAHQYLHHLVSIRKFCRVRIVDETVAGAPLRISEWRAALWGDYSVKEVNTVRKDATGENPEPLSPVAQRRVKKTVEAKNAVAKLFGARGNLPSYACTSQPSLGSLIATLDASAHDPRIRALLLWESHEINFRCELMALDFELGGGAKWPTQYRWDREREVSAVWGPPSSAFSVIPAPTEAATFCWPEGGQEGWREAASHLVMFVKVMGRWPGGQNALGEVSLDTERWTVSDYDAIQGQAIAFYVRSFIDTYGRMPLPPIAFPSHVPLP